MQISLDRFEPFVQDLRVCRQDVLAAHDPGMDHVGRRCAKGRKDRRGGEDVNPFDSQIGGKAGGMNRAGPAKGIDHELLGQIAGSHHLAADEVSHLAVDDVINPRSRFGHCQFQGARDLFRDRLLRLLFVELLSTAEKIVRVDNSQDQVGVGDRDLFSAGVVANGTGTRPGALGSDHEPACVRIYSRYGSSAGADGLDIDDRLQDAEALHDRLLGISPVALGDKADVEAGSSHVRGDDIFMPQQPGHVRRRDHAAGRTGLEIGNGGDMLAVGGAAIALHNKEKSLQTIAPEFSLQVFEITRHGRAEITVDDGRIGPGILSCYQG